MSWRRYGFYIIAGAHVALIARAFLTRLPALDPPSLTFDDVWVAVLTKAESFAELVGIKTPHPVGFLVLLRIFKGWVSDPEVSLQLLPFGAGLLVIPVTGLLVYRLTSQPSLGVLGAALAALNPNVARYSVHVKPYLTDYLVTVALFILGFRLLKNASKSSLLWTAALGLAASLISFTAVFPAIIFVHLSLWQSLRAWRGNREPIWLKVLTVTCFDLALFAYYGFDVRYRSNPAIRNYWGDAFLAVESPMTFLKFLYTSGKTALEGAAPHLWIAGPLLAGLGLFALLRKREERIVGVVFALFYAALLAASALRLYPLGGGRTDIFSYSATLCLLCCGTAFLARRRAIMVALGVSGWLAAMLYSVTPQYPTFRDPELISKLEILITEDDALILHPPANWTVGYYGRWPVEFRPVSYWGPGFEVHLKRQRSLTLPRPLYAIPGAMDRFLAETEPRGIFYFAKRVSSPPHSYPMQADELIRQELSHRGYRVEEDLALSDARLTIFGSGTSGAPEESEATRQEAERVIPGLPSS